MNERENLREPRRLYYLLAQFVAGEVFHVDSLVRDGRVLFAGANRYGRPPLEVAHGGGAYSFAHSRAPLGRREKVVVINRQLVKTLKHDRGAAHAEFIKSDADGQFYFLEIAARVGGAYIADVLEAASGLNLWREWARMKVADGRARRQAGAGGRKQEQAAGAGPEGRRHSESEIKVKPLRNEYAGSCCHFPSRTVPNLCLRRSGNRLSGEEGSSCGVDCPVEELNASRIADAVCRSLR